MQESTIHVAVIEPVGGHGGMDYYDFGLANGLTEAGVKVSLYTCDKTNPPVAPAMFKLYRPFRSIYGNLPRIVRATLFVIGMLCSLVHARLSGIRIVHLHLFDTSLLQFVCMVSAKAVGMRTVVTAHDVESLAGHQAGRLARRIYGMADRVIAHNRVSSSALVKTIGLSIRKIHVIPHGHYIDNNCSVDQGDARMQLGVQQHQAVILFFGQIKQVKGLDILLRALPAVVARHPDVMLIVAGKLWKTELSVYSSLIRELGIERHVKLDIRYIPNEEVVKYYAAADLVVLPYRKIYQSGVLLMAMSYRRPVVVSNIQCMLEIVDDGLNGYVFEMDKPDHLATRVIDALHDQHGRKVIGEAGYRSVSENNSWQLVGKKTSEIYHSVFAKGVSHHQG